MRPTLLRVLTDLYVQKLTHTPDEERHYTELALRLLDAVDVATRAAAAAGWRAICRRRCGSSSNWRLICPKSRRPCADTRAASQSAASEAAESRSPLFGNCRSSGNRTAEFEGKPPSKKDAVPAAGFPDSIAADVANELNELFFAASADERRLILLNLEIVAPLPVGRVPLRARRRAVGRRLEAAALARNREDFAQHLAFSLQIPFVQARRIASDVLGEPIVVAAKAINMPRDVVYRILLFVNTTVGHSVERVHALAPLYDELTVQAAEHMVAIWQALHRHEHPRTTSPAGLERRGARPRAHCNGRGTPRAARSGPNERREVPALKL